MSQLRIGLSSALLMLATTFVLGDAHAGEAAGSWYYIHGKGKNGGGFQSVYVFVPSGTWQNGSTVPEIPVNAPKRECRMDLQPPPPTPDKAGSWHKSNFTQYSGYVYVPHPAKYPANLTPPPYPTAPPTKATETCSLDDPTPVKKCLKWKDKKKTKCAKWS